jgi:hypothetical protein
LAVFHGGVAGRTALGEGFGGRGGVHLSEASRFGTNATSIASVVIARSEATKHASLCSQ